MRIISAKKGDSNPEFGSGKGNDNVCDCDAFVRKDV